MIKEDLAVDQAMIVIKGVQKRHVYDGRVARIARKYVTIEYWISPGVTRELEFDIETQKERGDASNYAYAAVFRTTEQHELHERQRSAQEGMRNLGLSMMPSCKLTLEQQESIIVLVTHWAEYAGEDTDAEEADPGTPPGS